MTSSAAKGQDLITAVMDFTHLSICICFVYSNSAMQYFLRTLLPRALAPCMMRNITTSQDTHITSPRSPG